MAADGLPTILDLGITHSLADTYFSQNTSVGVRGYAADRYAKSAKSKDTAMELEEPLTDACYPRDVFAAARPLLLARKEERCVGARSRSTSVHYNNSLWPRGGGT